MPPVLPDKEEAKGPTHKDLSRKALEAIKKGLRAKGVPEKALDIVIEINRKIGLYDHWK